MDKEDARYQRVKTFFQRQICRMELHTSTGRINSPNISRENHQPNFETRIELGAVALYGYYDSGLVRLHERRARWRLHNQIRYGGQR